MHKKIADCLLAICVFAAVSDGTDAASFIVKDGVAKAEIIVAEEPTRSQRYAAEELRDIIKKISGAELTITAEATAAFPVKIYIGRSAFTDQLNLTAEGLAFDAYRIVTGKNHIVFFGDDSNFSPNEPWAHSSGDRTRVQNEWDDMTGARWACPGLSTFKAYNKKLDLWHGDGKGSLNAVYDFLRSLGARWYFPGELGECLPERKTIELPDINKTVIPDFGMRKIGGSGYVYGRGSQETVIWGMRLGWHTPGYSGTHGIDHVLHHDTNRKNHLDWFMVKDGERDTVSRGGKPCLSSEGLKQSNIEYARTLFAMFPDLGSVSVMPTDGYVTLCECDLCTGKGTRERGYNGYLSDYVWGYVNDVAKEVYKTHPDKKIICGAYSAYRLPPLSIERMSPNVMVRLAQSRRNNFDENAKHKWYELRAMWLPKLTGKKPFLTHDNLSLSGQSPFPMYYPRLIVEDLRSLNGISLGDYVEANTHRARDEYPYQSLAITHLNMYVTSRAWWDAELDLDALLDEYYETFYGPAAQEMKAFIEFSEANWFKMKTDVARVDEALELMAAALKAVDDESIYGKRVALVDSYLYRMKQLRDKIAIGRKENRRARIFNSRGRALKVDGIFDDEIWQVGAPQKLRDIITGGEPRVGTWFRPAWKDGNLYFAIHCEEPDMEHLNIGTTRNEDPAIWNGDTVEILLETQNHSYYQIAVNPAGAMMDMDWQNGARISKWESDADVAVHRGEDFWNVEIMIPVADENQEVALPYQLVSGRTPTTVETWFFNIGRSRKRESDREASMFSPTGVRRFHDASKFGVLYME